MEVIAKGIDEVLIRTTDDEVREIITSVSGKRPTVIEIGQKIPAIDYATTVLKLKSLSSEYSFIKMFEWLESFYQEAISLKESVVEAGSIGKEM